MGTRVIIVASVSALVAAAAPASAQTAISDQPAQSASRADWQKTLEGRFAQMDGNKDGTLTRAELQATHTRTLNAANAAVAQRLQQEFTATDSNKDGKIDQVEAVAAAPANRKADAPKAIARFDSDKDGAISLAEFRAGAPKPRLGDVANFLNRFDANKDGSVTAAEYRAPGLQAFDALDANKDGVVSAAERQPRPAPQGR